MSDINAIFYEAISHCRWKKVLNNLLLQIDIEEFRHNSFLEIIKEIHKICENINGIGMLTIYDISASICNYYGINIDKIYIIGDGPKRAIKLLGLNPKIEKISYKINNEINKNFNLKYVEIDDVISAFIKNNYDKTNKYDPLPSSNNGDEFESYLCNWQKTILTLSTTFS